MPGTAAALGTAPGADENAGPYPATQGEGSGNGRDRETDQQERAQEGPEPEQGGQGQDGPGQGGAEPLRLAVIVGSVRKGRFGPVVSDWFAREAREHGGFEVDVIDLADEGHQLPYSFAESGVPLPPGVRGVHGGLSRRLAAADAFVIVTPEYNHSFPAPLKNTIDWFRDEWQAKPAGFVSYGGMAGGQRAVEHLRQVFAELHAVTVRETLSFHMAWQRFDEHGRPRDEAAGPAARGMLRQLAWWGSALRDARAKSPYGAAV